MNEQKDEIKIIIYELAKAKNRIEVLIDSKREKYMSLDEAERLGEIGWDIEDAINDLYAAKDNISSAIKYIC